MTPWPWGSLDSAWLRVPESQIFSPQLWKKGLEGWAWHRAFCLSKGPWGTWGPARVPTRDAACSGGRRKRGAHLLLAASPVLGPPDNELDRDTAGGEASMLQKGTPWPRHHHPSVPGEDTEAGAGEG